MALSMAFAQPAAAQTAPSAAESAAAIDALSRASAAVVGVRVTAADDARSIATLGKERAGSGVLIGKDGLILTIGYLMLEAQDIRIVTQDNKTLPAVAVGYDLATGFGLIKPLLPLKDVTPVELGSQASVETGEPLMAAIGSTETNVDADVSLTRLVSKRGFSGSWEYHIDSALFTSPPVMAGNGNHSGAALFNRKGELLGIGSLLVMDALGQNRRLPGNMFVPVDLLKPILAEMQSSGTSRLSIRPWLGVTSSDASGRVQVLRVSPDSPAEKAGLKSGDVVLAVDGSKVATLESFYKKLWARDKPEDTIQLTVLQGADVNTVRVQPENRMATLRKASGI
ncbi:MAG: serine protease [Betaproteobacteria bacterium]|nr:serine protease [Betaproteobacteria bacterium]